ncbi:hypothetical protein E4N62_30935 [Streptomyces sp. MNU76]|uniref:hypothetical protein n=1 Tax=Streptomyces sp. MNU76 TaxID=2560026 RepID=UPI001E2E42AB|nr:hypothetical protein [Streptomyces sp. MNU76]MCC9709280.1 hypothetical protein [Streptomyces sp. MNU76]
MADEQYRWLNRDAAERLLRGEPLEAVDADTRDRAARLAEALGALTADVAPVSSRSPELPGEEAALAAFRSARTARASDATTSATSATSVSSTSARSALSSDGGRAVEPGRGSGSRKRTADAPAADAGLVRLGRPGRPAGVDGHRARWGRPVRFGLVAAVAAGMLGGVAVAVGGGALTAFRDGEPEPSATVSAGQSPDRPLLSPSPKAQDGDGRRGAWGDTKPEMTPDGSAQGDGPSGDGSDGTDEDGRTGDSGKNGTPGQEWWNKVLSACRDVRDGKGLGADRRRSLEDAAGGNGKGQLKRYCEGVLAGGSDYPGTKKRPGGAPGRAGARGAGPVRRTQVTRPAGPVAVTAARGPAATPTRTTTPTAAGTATARARTAPGTARATATAARARAVVMARATATARAARGTRAARAARVTGATATGVSSPQRRGPKWPSASPPPDPSRPVLSHPSRILSRNG